MLKHAAGDQVQKIDYKVAEGKRQMGIFRGLKVKGSPSSSSGPSDRTYIPKHGN